VVAASISLLAVHLFAIQAKGARVYVPLTLFFLANFFTEILSLINSPMILDLYPFWPRFLLVCSVPLSLMLAPLFWIYVRALTSRHHVVWRKTDSWHFSLALLSLSIPLLSVYLGQQDFLHLFDRPRLTTTNTQMMLIAAIKTVDILIILQVTFYIVIIMRRLTRYQNELVQLFASTEHLELKWIRWLAVFLGAYAVVSSMSLLFDKFWVFEPWESVIDLALLWFLIVWGLRQKPGLADELAATQQANEIIESSTKYQHSALSDEQLKNIAARVESSMREQQLYRDSNLSLRVLSGHINELPNYVSQALNQEIGESFFDYVNQWRIKEAKQQLSTSDSTVLTIAEEVGFNSRSSFYNAFKKATGQTPTSFKKSLNHG